MNKLLLFILIVMIGFSVQAQEAMTLEKAMDIAFTNSPSLIQSKISLEQGRLNLKAQHASLKSQFTVGLDPFQYSHNNIYDQRIAQWYSSENMSSSGSFGIRQPIKWTDGSISLINNLSWQKASNTSSGISNTSFNNNVSIRIDQPIFTYNRTKLQLKELEYALENAKISYVMQQLSIEKNVTTSFYGVYQQQQRYNIAQEEFRNQKSNYDIIKNKVEAGLIAKDELFQAEVNLASSESTLYSAKINYENSKDNFKLLLGMPLDEKIVVLPNTSVGKVQIDVNKAVINGLEQRQEIRRQQINIERGTFDLIRAESENEFKGNLSAEFGLTGLSEDFNHMYDKPTKDQRVKLSLTIPIWDWGAKKAKVSSTKLGMKSTQISFEEEKKNIALAIRQICRNLPILEKQVDIAKKNIENSQRTYEINTEKYRSGNITGIQLQQYQTQLTQKKQDYINAVISYKIELLNLKTQSLWDFENNHSYLEEKIKLIPTEIE